MLAERIQSFANETSPSSAEFLHLPGTGYDVKGDVDRFAADVNRLRSEGTSFVPSIHIASHSTAENMRGYRREYIMRFCAFPNPVEFAYVNGERVVVAPKYANARLEETAMKNERNGAVYDSTVKTVRLLKDAPNGSLVVWTSPPGPAGWETRDGNPVIYPDSLTFAYRVNLFGELEAMSFITDMSFEQNKEFLKIISGEDRDFFTDEDIVRTVVYKPAIDSRRYTLEHVVDALKDAKQSKFARGMVTFDEMTYLVRNKDEIVWEDEKAEEIIEQFLDWVGKNVADLDPQTLQLLQRQIAQSVLNLVAHSPHVASYVVKDGVIEYQKVLAIMQELGGCAGGGMVNGRRYTEGKYVKRCGNCGVEINDYIARGYRCSKCGGVYEGC